MMLFSTETERDMYFRRLNDDPRLDDCGRIPALGEAFGHAIATNLGVWGDTTALQRDVSRILAAEINGHFDCGIPVTSGMVRDSVSFQHAFQFSRKPGSADIHNLVRSLGSNSLHMKEENGSLTDNEIEAMRTIHVDVLDDLGLSWRRKYR